MPLLISCLIAALERALLPAQTWEYKTVKLCKVQMQKSFCFYLYFIIVRVKGLLCCQLSDFCSSTCVRSAEGWLCLASPRVQCDVLAQFKTFAWKDYISLRTLWFLFCLCWQCIKYAIQSVKANISHSLVYASKCHLTNAEPENPGVSSHLWHRSK